ncbi:MAG: TolC family outer membrane protein [Chromatiales bacterium]|jgi:outer membrane protein|nr:TolC family outer membrane protein [Chromatiales bacterium]
MNKLLRFATGIGFAALTGLSAVAQGADLISIHRLALQNDPQMHAAEAQRLADMEAKPQARSQLLPFVGLSAGYSRLNSNLDSSSALPAANYNFNTAQWTVSLVQPIYHHQYFAQLHQADAVLGRADAVYSAAQQALLVRSAQAYFGVLAARDLLTFASAEKESIGRQLEQAKQRFDVGLIAITDVHVAQAAYDLATARAIEAANKVQSANEALFELTGEFVDGVSPLIRDVPLLPPQPAQIDDWVKAAMDQNFNLIAARFGAEVAEQNVALQRSGHYPTLDLVGSIGSTDYSSDAPPQQRGGENASIGLQLNVPLYAGGAVNSRTRQAGFLYTQAKEQVEQQRRLTLRQTRDAYNAVIAAVNRVKALAQARVSAASALEATEAGMEVGTRTAVEVLTARTDLYRAESDYAQARYDYLLNTLLLKQAAGTLSLPDLEQINGWLM